MIHKVLTRLHYKAVYIQRSFGHIFQTIFGNYGYQNVIFVGSVKPNGDLYHFDLNSNRTYLDLQGLLEDRIADNYQELEKVISVKISELFQT
jgi:hypothetical protein